MKIAKKKIKLTEDEIKVILSIMSLVHPENKMISSVHMIRILAVSLSRWYEVKVAWTGGYMNRDISYVFLSKDEKVTLGEIIEQLGDDEYIIAGRVPVCDGSKLTQRGYSLGPKSVEFLKANK